MYSLHADGLLLTGTSIEPTVWEMPLDAFILNKNEMYRLHADGLLLTGTSIEPTVWELLLKLPKTDVSEIVLYFTKNVNVINFQFKVNHTNKCHTPDTLSFQVGIDVFIVKCSVKSGITWPQLFEGWIMLFTR